MRGDSFAVIVGLGGFDSLAGDGQAIGSGGAERCGCIVLVAPAERDRDHRTGGEDQGDGHEVGDVERFGEGIGRTGREHTAVVADELTGDADRRAGGFLCLLRGARRQDDTVELDA
jgi:hypothetical protein